MKLYSVLYQAGKDNGMNIPNGQYGVREYFANTDTDALMQFLKSEMHRKDTAIAVVPVPAYNVSTNLSVEMMDRLR